MIEPPRCPTIGSFLILFPSLPSALRMFLSPSLPLFLHVLPLTSNHWALCPRHRSRTGTQHKFLSLWCLHSSSKRLTTTNKWSHIMADKKCCVIKQSKVKRIGIWYMYSFHIAAIINNVNLVSQNNRNLFSYSSGGFTFKVKVSAGLHSPELLAELLGETLFLASFSFR